MPTVGRRLVFRQSTNVLGTIDFQANVLTLGRFNLPEAPPRIGCMNNLWGANQTEPYSGDAVNAYNDGPPAPGKKGAGAVLRDRVALARPAAEDRPIADPSPLDDPHSRTAPAV